jgi:alpha-galactosidase
VNLTTISGTALAVYKNTEIIAIDQDPLCGYGQRYQHIAQGGDFIDVWAKPLTLNRVAIVVVNRAATTQSFTVNWEMIGINGSRPIRDVWAHTNLTPSDHVNLSLASHDNAMFIIPGARLETPTLMGDRPNEFKPYFYGEPIAHARTEHPMPDWLK